MISITSELQNTSLGQVKSAVNGDQYSKPLKNKIGQVSLVYALTRTRSADLTIDQLSEH